MITFRNLPLVCSLLLFTALFTSCTKDEPKPVTIIGKSSSVADGMISVKDDDGTWTIKPTVVLRGNEFNILTPTVKGESVELNIAGTGKSKYSLSSYTYVNYVDGTTNYSSTNSYSTQTGNITITEHDAVKKTISGTYTAKVYYGYYDYKTISGSFNKLSYTTQTTQSDLFSFTLDGYKKTATNVEAYSSGSYIVLTGKLSTGEYITLDFLNTVTSGSSYSLGYSQFYPIYRNLNGTVLDANSGTLTITSHSKTNRTISGTFSFVTEFDYSDYDNHYITNGTFNCSY